VYSIAAHGAFITAAMFVVEIDWSDDVGVSNLAPEIAMVSRAQSLTVPISRELEPTTEVPPILDMVDVVEEIPMVEPPPDEPKDPLLDEDPFEDLELDPLPIPEPETPPQEPVGEEPEPERRLLESPLPVYPRSAAMRRLEGTVVLEMTVDPSGGVVEVELVSTSGHGSLDRAAIKAAHGYRFEAGDGTLTVSKTFTFRLP